MSRTKQNIYSFFNCFIFSFLILACTKDDNDSGSNVESSKFNLIVADITAETGGAIISINPITGEQTIISTGGLFWMGPSDVAIDENGLIFTTDVGRWAITKIDPVDSSQTLISSGGFLKNSIQGIACIGNGKLLVTKGDVSGDRTVLLLRIDIITGEQEVLSEGGEMVHIDDVTVSNKGAIYVSGQGIVTIGEINYTTAAIFQIDPTSGEQTEVFKSMDLTYTRLGQIDIDNKGNILAIAYDPEKGSGTIISINPLTGQHSVIVPSEREIYFNGISCAANGDVYVTRNITFSGTNNSICRVNLENGTLEPFSYDGYLENPNGMDILYSE
jgi:hypothetical protein